MGIPFVRTHAVEQVFRRKLEVAAILLFWLSLCGCAHQLGFVTYYDPVTYKNLTDLKPEILALYDSFATDSLNSSQIAGLRLKLAQMYEYEYGKGQKNAETSEQIKILRNLFEKHVDDRMKNGKWSATHLSNQKQNLTEAFDIAIQTERIKNKNE